MKGCEEMKIKFWPNSKSGQAAAVLTLLFIILMLLKMGTLGLQIILPVPSPMIAILGIVGLVFGLISIVVNKDRAIMTWLSVPVGLLIFFWIGAEMLYPH